MVFKFLINSLYKHVIIYSEFGFKSKTAQTNVCPISNINYDIVVQNNLYIETSKYNY